MKPPQSENNTLDRLLAEVRSLEGRTKTHGALHKPLKSWETLTEIACARLGINPLLGQRLMAAYENEKRAA